MVEPPGEIIAHARAIPAIAQRQLASALDEIAAIGQDAAT